ncbi:MAG: hypothetical protein HWQ41_00820 [Nostoc sp. NOS(2021)]|uniref:hypothetical protein n=1 Tax=Nostoc sp. NOS(2021) TaxID=2815407 RepID=UPI0025FFA0BE|nr:hypothetical protein [Nostoc sp. NOS(2021)]MBN3893883.1 hypothetical protein [Nostoc sp. NOS(2021)]
MHQATRSRTPVASPKGRRYANKSAEPTPVAHGGNPQDRAGSPTHWLGYTGKTHLSGLKTFDFLLIHAGGLCLYSRDF